MSDNDESFLKDEIEIEKIDRQKPKVSIVFGTAWLEQCDRIPKVEKRVSFEN